VPGTSRWYVPFPPALHSLSAAAVVEAQSAAAAAVASGRLPLPGSGLPLSLDAQAGIVNLYPCSRPLPMGGHRDDMERTLEAPVLSLSLGATAVFLLGGTVKGNAPTPILLRSGDAMLLSGACRLAYHGVARVFEGAGVPHAPPLPPVGSEDWAAGALTEYLRKYRLNVNVRQVLPPEGSAAFL
jgi:hypothetical protein